MVPAPSKLLPVLAALPCALAAPSSAYTTQLFTSSWATFPTGWAYGTGTSYSGGPSSWGTGENSDTTSDYDVAAPSGGKLWVEANIRLGDRELDIPESANGHDAAGHTVHCGTTPGGPRDETDGIGASGSMSRGEFHVLACEVDASNGDWRSQFVRFLVDGEERHGVTGSDIGEEEYWTPPLRRTPR
ncbi:glucan endo-1,3-beta-glucosidase A1-like protein [Zalerion maritima]|uniref:Glucan endo-1,3-beta-glucosidase A1-like protein n=1 Tax=Zalerion maritima TaxID=339359 RepID=A0AAD5RKG7_9PEZI|nr:glucan endo-1,3-beta-glucosidase A1-like protein [Zalerion maritima]